MKVLLRRPTTRKRCADQPQGRDGQTYHKADAQDRNALREKVELSVDPLDPGQHQDGLVNVVTGKVVVHPSVNVTMCQWRLIAVSSSSART